MGRWLHPVACLRHGTAPLTPLRGGLDDLALALDIIRALPPHPGAAG